MLKETESYSSLEPCMCGYYIGKGWEVVSLYLGSLISRSTCYRVVMGIKSSLGEATAGHPQRLSTPTPATPPPIIPGQHPHLHLRITPPIILLLIVKRQLLLASGGPRAQHHPCGLFRGRGRGRLGLGGVFLAGLAFGVAVGEGFFGSGWELLVVEEGGEGAGEGLGVFGDLVVRAVEG